MPHIFLNTTSSAQSQTPILDSPPESAAGLRPSPQCEGCFLTEPLPDHQMSLFLWDYYSSLHTFPLRFLPLPPELPYTQSGVLTWLFGNAQDALDIFSSLVKHYRPTHDYPQYSLQTPPTLSEGFQSLLTKMKEQIQTDPITIFDQHFAQKQQNPHSQMIIATITYLFLTSPQYIFQLLISLAPLLSADQDILIRNTLDDVFFHSKPTHLGVVSLPSLTKPLDTKIDLMGLGSSSDGLVGQFEPMLIGPALDYLDGKKEDRNSNSYRLLVNSLRTKLLKVCTIEEISFDVAPGLEQRLNLQDGSKSVPKPGSEQEERLLHQDLIADQTGSRTDRRAAPSDDNDDDNEAADD